MNEISATFSADSSATSTSCRTVVESKDLIGTNSNALSLSSSIDAAPVHSQCGDHEEQIDSRHHDDPRENVEDHGEDDNGNGREDVEGNSDDIICWICHDNSNTKDNPFGQYCQCTLRSTQVHEHCLERWVFAYHHTHCATCNASYNIVQPDAKDMPSITTWISRQAVLLRFFFLPLLRAAFIPSVLLVLYIIVLPCSIGGSYFVGDAQKLLSGLEERMRTLLDHASSSAITTPFTLFVATSKLLFLSLTDLTSLSSNEFPVLIKAWLCGAGHILFAVWLRREWRKYLAFVQSIVRDYSSSSSVSSPSRVSGEDQEQQQHADLEEEEEYDVMYNIIGDSIAHAEANPLCFSEIEHCLHHLRRLRQQLTLSPEAWQWLGCAVAPSMLLSYLLSSSAGRATAVLLVLVVSLVWRWLSPPQPTPPIYSYRGAHRTRTQARRQHAANLSHRSESENTDHTNDRSRNDYHINITTTTTTATATRHSNNLHAHVSSDAECAGEATLPRPYASQDAGKQQQDEQEAMAYTSADATEAFTAQLLRTASTTQHVKIFILHIFRYLFIGPLPLTLGFVIERALTPYLCSTDDLSFLGAFMQPLTPRRALFHWTLGIVALATRQVIHLACIDLLFSRRSFIGVFRIVGFDFKRTTLELFIHMYTHSDLLRLIGYFLKEWCGLIVFFYSFFSLFMWATFYAHKSIRHVIGDEYFHAPNALPLSTGFPASYPQTIGRAGTIEGWIQHQQIELWLTTLIGFLIAKQTDNPDNYVNASTESVGATLESTWQKMTSSSHASQRAGDNYASSTNHIYTLDEVPLANNTRSPFTLCLAQAYESLVYGDESDHGIVYTLFGMVPPDPGSSLVPYTAALNQRTRQNLCAATLTETALWTQWNPQIQAIMQSAYHPLSNIQAAFAQKTMQQAGGSALAGRMSDYINYSHTASASNQKDTNDKHTNTSDSRHADGDSNHNALNLRKRDSSGSKDALNVKHLITVLLEARRYMATQIYNEEDAKILARSWMSNITHSDNRSRDWLVNSLVRGSSPDSGQQLAPAEPDFLTFEHPVGCAALIVLTAARPFFILRPFAWFIASFLIRYSSLVITVYNVAMLVFIATCLISISFLLDPSFIHLMLHVAQRCVRLNLLDEALVFDRTKLAWIEKYTVPRSLEDLDIFVTDDESDADDVVDEEGAMARGTTASTAAAVTTRRHNHIVSSLSACSDAADDGGPKMHAQREESGQTEGECDASKLHSCRGSLSAVRRHIFSVSPSWARFIVWRARLFLFSFTYLFCVAAVISIVPMLCIALFLFIAPYSVPILITALAFSFFLLDRASFMTTACGFAVAVFFFSLSPLFIVYKLLSLFLSFSSNKIAQGALNYHYGVRYHLLPIKPNTRTHPTT